MKIIRKTLLIAGITSIMLTTSAFATEVQVAADVHINEAVQTEAQAATQSEIQENIQTEIQPEVKQAPASKKGIVTVDILNVRKGPSTDNEKLGHLSLGATVEILSENNGWYEINFESQKAYICAEYIRIIDNTVTDTANIGQSIVDYAKQFIGTPYVAGGASPKGFDCSGFTQYVLANFGVSLPRTSTDQYAIGVRVDKSELLPGDLVYFKYNANSYRLGHVGIYVGDGNFIHSPVPGQTVKISPLNTGYFSYYYYGAVRVLK